LMLLLVLFAAVVVLVPSFFGDDAPFAEDILLLKERSLRLNSLSLVVVVVGKKNVCSSSSFCVFSLPLLLLNSRKMRRFL
jgi:hypothetical protein